MWKSALVRSCVCSTLTSLGSLAGCSSDGNAGEPTISPPAGGANATSIGGKTASNTGGRTGTSTGGVGGIIVTSTARGGTAGTSSGTSGGVTSTGGANASGTSSEFRVIGYEPSWSGDVAAIQYDKLTAINYAFANVSATGDLEDPEDVSKLDRLVKLAHQNQVEVFISIGGWNDGDDSAFHTMAASSITRDKFANQVLSFVEEHALDGADIDWEYPDSGQSARDYTSLMTLLATKLHSVSKKLTAAVVAEGGDGVEEAVFAQVDYLNLMAYDGGDGAAHSPYSYAVTALDYWLSRGLPKHKCVLGVPFYARPSWNAYSSIVAQDSDAPNKDTSNGDYYNGIPTMQAKTKLALERASGVMIWELSQDTTGSTSLLSAIHSASNIQ